MSEQLHYAGKGATLTLSLALVAAAALDAVWLYQTVAFSGVLTLSLGLWLSKN